MIPSTPLKGKIVGSNCSLAMNKKTKKNFNDALASESENDVQRVGGAMSSGSAPKKPLPPPDPRDRNPENRISPSPRCDE